MSALPPVHYRLEYPYTRTTGPIVGAFLTALRDGKLLGIRCGSRVLCPPLEYDPETGETLAPDFVEVGPGGTILSWTWIAEPSRKHPFAEPFAFALVRPDGADSAICHALKASGPDALRTGGRVRTQYREERCGAITDLYFAPEAEAQDRYVPPGKGAVEMTEHLISLDYSEPLSPHRERYAKGLLDGKFIGQKSPASGKVYLPSKGYDPIERVRMSERDDVVVADRGTVVAYTVITPVQYYGQQETEPYIRASILLDGADQPLGQQDIRSIKVEHFRSGMRLRAVWKPKAERSVADVDNRWGGHRLRDRTLGADRRARPALREDHGAQLVSRDEAIAIVAVAQTPARRQYPDSEASMLMDLTNQLLAETGLERSAVDFTIAGSCDYLSGMPFAFVSNVDGFGAWPPVYESHVEMDGAWALFEAWVRLSVGDIDVALVAGSGKSSPGAPREIFPLQADPYTAAPLGLDPVSVAGLQARALLDAGLATERDFAEVVSRSRRDALGNPNAQVKKDVSADALLAEPYYTSPLRKHDLPPISDGAAAVLIARGDRARELAEKPVWIRGIDHRIDSHHLGLRNLTDSPSTRLAAKGVDLHAGPIDVAELCVRYSPEEIVLRRALELAPGTQINPSGGPLCAHPVMATGLVRVIEVARRIREGRARRGVAHAASGAALQQNLLCVLEGEA